jgi:hypothetical protein
MSDYDSAYFAMKARVRDLERERDELKAAIESAIVELCPPVQTFQARRILREALGQPQGQIYNDPQP